MLRLVRGRTGLLLAACVLGAALSPSVSHGGEPVEYVKICDEHGTGYYYLPGTETCHNPEKNEAIEATAGGLWTWRMPGNPIKWIQAPRKICRGGRLIEFGTLDASKFVLNAYDRVEATTTVPLSLADREYVSSVIYRGDLANGPSGDFCLFYHYVDMVEGSVYLPLGCASATTNARQPALLSYAPDIQPPDTTNPVFLVGASGRRWTPVPELITGTLDIWLCIKKTKANL